MALKGNAKPRVPECHPERKHSARGPCKACYDEVYQKEHVADSNKTKDKWLKGNPEKRRLARLKYLYDLDADEVKSILKAQDGNCWICQTGPAEHMDHDHATGNPRGFLCGNCNRGLGLFKDDGDSLRRAVMYLALFRGDFDPRWEDPASDLYYVNPKTPVSRLPQSK